MKMEFDSAKDAANLRKHGLSLAVFHGFDSEPAIVADTRADYGEPRYLAFGRIGGVAHCVVFTLRNEAMRLISFRRAHEKEIRRYE